MSPICEDGAQLAPLLRRLATSPDSPTADSSHRLTAVVTCRARQHAHLPAAPTSISNGVSPAYSRIRVRANGKHTLNAADQALAE